MQQQVASICDFENPPLTEVVLGVQFAAPSNFRLTDFAGVHDLFRDEFPTVVDQAPLPPQFETFGGGVPSQGIQLEFGVGPVSGRVWFVSADNTHLIQFQGDRLLLNWRDQPTARYPRYGAISNRFAEQCERLSRYFESAFGAQMSINQAEVSYINIINVNGFEEVGAWLKVVDLSFLKPEGFGLNYAEIVVEDGKPVGRLYTEISSGFDSRNRSKMIRLGLTFRGAPNVDTIDSARALLDSGRERIVNRFCAMTTQQAHARWGKKS
jgi:uncharacterized protein (TIGR04255 family)